MVRLLSSLFALAQAAPSPGIAPRCVEFHNAAPGSDFLQQVMLPMSNDLVIYGNVLGMQGHKTTLMTQCSLPLNTAGTGRFGWNWTRGTTTKQCSNPQNPQQVCPYNPDPTDPYCYYQFSFHEVQYGINAWGVASSNKEMRLPVNSRNLKKLNVIMDPTYNWVDKAKTAPTSPVYRSRLIFDFFLSSAVPKANQNSQHTLTDEIVIELAHNPDFELPCGYKYKKNHSILQPDVFTVNGEKYDLVEITDDDLACNTCNRFRMTHFRRQGSTCAGGACQVPQKVDLMPFIQFAQNPPAQFKRTTGTAGPWVGSVDLGTEIYDNTQGSVTLSKFEVFPVSKSQEPAMVV